MSETTNNQPNTFLQWIMSLFTNSTTHDEESPTHEEDVTKDIYDLDMHESTEVTNSYFTRIQRVPNGWLYTDLIGQTTCFVPYVDKGSDRAS